MSTSHRKRPGRPSGTSDTRDRILTNARELFARNGIAVEWQRYAHPVYPQQHGPFVPYLSALDLLLNCGDEAPLIAFPGIR